MPFQVYDILAMHSSDKQAAIRYCQSVATNFPQFREEYEQYARLLTKF